MKTLSKMLLLSTVCAMAICAVSCEKEPQDPSQQEIETNIIGKWKLVGRDGKEVVTNMSMVCTYYPGGKSTISTTTGYKLYNEKNIWIDNIEFKYSLNGNVLKEEKEGHWRESTIRSIDAKRMTLSIDKIYSEGQITELGWLFEFVKVTADFSQDIVGMWEGVEVTGEETYGGAEACIEYRADGSYTYYTKKGDGWAPSANTDNEYNVDGDWLAHRWRPETGADYNYEWWDIESIKDGQMKWTALRAGEDGSTYATTFTWKKVEFVPSVYLAGSTPDAIYIYRDGKQLYSIDCSMSTSSPIPPITRINGLSVMSDGIYACGYRMDLIGGQSDPIIWKNGVPLAIDYNIQTNQNGFDDMIVIGDRWLCIGSFRQPDGTYRGVIFENGKEVFRSDSDINASFSEMAYDKSSGRYYVTADALDGIRLWCFDAITGKVISNDYIVRGDEKHHWYPYGLAAAGGKVAVSLRKGTIAVAGVDYDAWCWKDGDLANFGFGNQINAVVFHNGILYAGGFKGSDFNDYMGTSIPGSKAAARWVDGSFEDLSAGFTEDSQVTLMKSWNDKFLYQVIMHSKGFEILCNGSPVNGGEYAENFEPTCMDVIALTVPKE